jgi:RNA polymerase sigma factor (sigma-70 family)
MLGDQIAFVRGRFRLTEHDEVQIRKAVARLPRHRKLAIHLLFWEDLTHSEIAARLGVSSSRLSKILSCATSKLRLDLHDVADRYFGIKNNFDWSSKK